MGADTKQRGTYGDGTVRTRPDGRMEKRVYLGIDPRTGKRIRKSVYGRNLRELQAATRTAIKKHQAASTMLAGRGTLAELVVGSPGVDGWLALKEREIGARTHRNYQVEWERYIQPELGGLRLDPEVFTVEVVTRWHASLAKRHGAYSANRARNLLSTILADAPTLRMQNPARQVRAAKHTRTPIEIFTAHELEVFLPATQRTRLRNLFLVALTTGLRHGEATALHWHDVHLFDAPPPGEDHGELHVRRAVVTTSTGLRVEPMPKTQAGRRVIGLTPEAAAAFRDQRKLLESEGLVDSRLVFPTSAGTLQPIERTGRSLRAVIESCSPRFTEALAAARRELREAGAANAKQRGLAQVRASIEYSDLLDVRPLSFHALRHTFASMMIALGMDAPRLALILGHSDPAFTMRTYVHFFEERRRQAMPRASVLVPSFGAIGGKIGGQVTGGDPDVE